MPWTIPLHTRSQINIAGDIASGRKLHLSAINLDDAVSIIGNWRSSHGYPLHVCKLELTKNTLKIDPAGLVVQRLKRLPAILAKLKRFPTMQLARFQDLGGCRSILKSVSRVDQLTELYRSEPQKVMKLVRVSDYISKPKPDGYRGIHLIHEYTGLAHSGLHSGLLVEIQLRTKYQHAWATALETIDTFTQQALKSGLGLEPWKRFFILMASAIAIKEERQPVEGTPDSLPSIYEELKHLCLELQVEDTLTGLSVAVEHEPSHWESKAYILILDSVEKKTSFVEYFDDTEAESDYMRLEKENFNSPHLQTVLVAIDSVSKLRSAYPNYYLDTSVFLELVRKITHEEPSNRRD